MLNIKKIISGGQTGADRAALDFALENGIGTGGFVPKGRIAEDGRISERYANLVETQTEDTDQRTKLNVRYSDATLIVSNGPLSGGSEFTAEFAKKIGKPFLHIDFKSADFFELCDKARKWIETNDVKILNIAGPRTSEDTEIYELTFRFLKELKDALSSRSSLPDG